MTLKENGPWTRESQALQQGFKKAGIDATLQAIPSTQWFDRLYTKRNHEGIAVNAGTLPFPWALAANYMMKASLLEEPAEVPEAGNPGPRGRLQQGVHLRDGGRVRDALKACSACSEAAVYHTVMAANQNVAPNNLQGVESTLVGDQRFDGAYFA